MTSTGGWLARSDQRREVSVVGSTGSIGTQTLEVLAADPERYHVVAIGAHSSVKALAEQATVLHPSVVALANPAGAGELAQLLPKGVELIVGEEALPEIARLGDIAVNAVVGFAGLSVTLACLEAGKRLALANKESLIAGAPVVQKARQTPSAEIVPVDSEHCAIHQCLALTASSADPFRPDGWPGLSRLIVTASGGPFRGRTRADLEMVSVDEALAHPTWKMGPKITVDSSTLMNKGLEVIEAHELFGVGYDAIEVVVHPQSVIHSMVEWQDGATLAQLSLPDMRLAIGYAIGYPERMASSFAARIDWRELHRLDFEEPDRATFACLQLAYEAGRRGGAAPAYLNAANEVAVEAFLEERIAWSAIADVVAATLDSYEDTALGDLGAVLEADSVARRLAREAVRVIAAAR